MRAARDTGRRIPEDISFVGFDDTLYALTTQPPLTTMRIDKELMGGLAVRQLYERAMNLDRPALTTLIGTQLVVRDSVAKCATGQAQPVR
jgi:DNA-binding LacI/PurR family transcriptional regulator